LLLLLLPFLASEISVRRWRLIVEEYGPTIIYLEGKHNIVADFLSRHPTIEDSINEIKFFNDIFTIDNDPLFPLSFDVIADHQAQDAILATIAHGNPLYTTRIVGNKTVIYSHDKIVVPRSLQDKIIEWYHTNLAHPGETRTFKTIEQHFTWSTLQQDVQKYVSTCPRCQHYKKQRKNYGYLPVKTHQDIKPWSEVHVDLIGPWIIPQKPKVQTNKKQKQDKKSADPPKVLALTMIDPATNYMELIAISSKESLIVARAFDRSWLCRYPRPLICLHDRGTEFTGFEFQELLQSYGIQSVTSTAANPQSNAILERTHQVIGNQIRSLVLMSIDITSLADIQHDILAPVQWAMNSTYHTTIQATAGQLAFNRDMILPTTFIAHWEAMRQRRQQTTDRDNYRENMHRIAHVYRNNDLVLIRQVNSGKLAKPTRGPYRVVDASNQFINGTIVVDLQHSQETYNIRRLLPFRRSPH
jgi:transposase InsO family protein